MSTKYIHFTDEEKQRAKDADLAAFLQDRGETLKKSGSELEWAGHHITIRGNEWYHQYDQRGGTAVDFVREYCGATYPEAVQMLLKMSAGSLNAAPYQPKEKVRQPFELPEANDNMRRVFAYLIKQRCIDRDVLSWFAHKKLIYEDAKYHNAVFVGADKDGKPRHAHKKSTSINDSSYRGNQTGSEAAFSFNHVGGSNKIYVFEAPIDMLSYISLNRRSWQAHS